MFAASAIDQALGVYRNPAKAKLARSNHAPKDVLEVIKIAAGDEGTLQSAANARGSTTQNALMEAAKLYLQNELSAAGKDAMKLLLLQPGASEQTLKDHKRWLLKWLHPDRNKNAWESKFFQPVREAAEFLEKNGVKQPQPIEKPSDATDKKRRSKRKLKRFVVPLDRQTSFWRRAFHALGNPISISAFIGALLFFLIVRFGDMLGLNSILAGL